MFKKGSESFEKYCNYCKAWYVARMSPTRSHEVQQSFEVCTLTAMYTSNGEKN